MTVFEAKVVFYAEDEEYGAETYFVAADSETAADARALALSEESRFFDDRIDFTRATEIDEAGFDLDDLPDGVVVHEANASGMAPA
jgi:hypothetical protein